MDLSQITLNASFDHELVSDSLLKLILALGFGLIIGFEREFHKHPGGLCTHVLVTLGSTIYTIVSQNIVPSMENSSYGGDPSRVASQIVSGIGFIGAGTIYKSDNFVKGLNPATTIWASAAVGSSIGAGLWEVGLMSSIFILAVLFINNIYRTCQRRRRRRVPPTLPEPEPSLEHQSTDSPSPSTQSDLPEEDSDNDDGYNNNEND